MRAALYSRVSTADQNTERQTFEMRDFVERRGWSVVAEEQDKLSGARERRPGLDSIMKLAKARKIDVVVVQSLDRWGRSLKHLVASLAELDELGVKFVSVTQGFDLTTSTGRAMYGMIAVMAEFERAMIRERIQSGLLRARRAGKRLGRPGRDLDRTKLARLLAAKTPLREIARRLRCSRTAVRNAISRL